MFADRPFASPVAVHGLQAHVIVPTPCRSPYLFKVLQLACLVMCAFSPQPSASLQLLLSHSTPTHMVKNGRTRWNRVQGGLGFWGRQHSSESGCVSAIAQLPFRPSASTLVSACAPTPSPRVAPRLLLRHSAPPPPRQPHLCLYPGSSLSYRYVVCRKPRVRTCCRGR